METIGSDIKIRVATPADAPALLAVYAPYVERTAITFEYEVPSVDEFANRIARTLERYPYLVAERADAGAVGTQGDSACRGDAAGEGAARSDDAGEGAARSDVAREGAARESVVLGYAYAGPFKDRPAYDWAVETTVYVAEGARRLGVGRALYRALEEALRAQGVLNLEACIAYPADDHPEPDPYLSKDSVVFHEHLGFKLVGRFTACGCKFDRWYDMVWMEKLIGTHGPGTLPIRPFPEVRSRMFA